MSHTQTSIKEYVTEITQLLDASTTDFETFEKVFMSFMKKTWHGLPTEEAQGCALSTAACIPVWELLHFFTSAYGPMSPRQRAFAVQLLSTLYPKSRDRRCVFQQLNCCGSNTASAVPLTVLIPFDDKAGYTYPVHEAESAYMAVVNRVASSVKTEEECVVPGGEKSLSSALTAFVQGVLPKCCLISSEAEKEKSDGSRVFIDIRDKGSDMFSWHTFLRTLWTLLVLAELHSVPEGRELGVFLSSSAWSNKTVIVNGASVSYAALLAPLVDASMVCLSVNARTIPTTTDNTPLIDPRILFLMRFDRGKAAAAGSSGSDALALAKAVSPTPLQLASSPIMQGRDEQTRETLLRTIPDEVDFMGASSSCRDCDQLTILCRSMLFAPISCDGTSSSGLATSTLQSILLNRKRPRDGSAGEGPSLLPVRSSLTDVLAERKKDDHTTLERLTLSWNSVQ